MKTVVALQSARRRLFFCCGRRRKPLLLGINVLKKKKNVLKYDKPTKEGGNMKKLWVALAMMLVLLCWGSAGAYEGWCSNCGYTIEKTVTDMGSYHQITCTGCGYTYEENHMGLCKDFSCYYCGSTNSEGATIGHSWSLTKDSGDGKHHYQECEGCGEINEGTHTVWCGENACGVCGSTNVGGGKQNTLIPGG